METLMPDSISIRVNGHNLMVQPGTIVAAAVALAGVSRFRSSIIGEARGPLCGMGICFECRVTIDGRPHARSCQVLVRNGMVVSTS